MNASVDVDVMAKPKAEAAQIYCNAALAEIEMAERPAGIHATADGVSFEDVRIADRLSHIASATRHLGTAIGFVAEALQAQESDGS